MILHPRARLALRIAQALALIGLAAYAAQSTWAVCGRGADALFETYVYNGLVAAGALFALSRAVAVRSERAAWATLALGLLAWAAGDAYYTIFLADLQEPLLPSVSDALWLAFYPASYVTLVLLVRARVHDFHASLWLDGFVGALAAAALGAALVFGAVAGSGMDTTVVAVDLTYLLADLLLLAFVVGVFAVTGWRPGRSLLLLGAALAAGSVADGFFLYQAVTGAELESTLMASLWPASALLAGFAAWQPAGGGRSPRLGGSRLVVVPIGFAALALGCRATPPWSPPSTAWLFRWPRQPCWPQSCAWPQAFGKTRCCSSAAAAKPWSTRSRASTTAASSCSTCAGRPTTSLRRSRTP